MFHGGFEWSTGESKKFEGLLDAGDGLLIGFPKATSSDEPWMFYMTPAFVDHCLKMAEGIISGIEQFGLERIRTHSQTKEGRPGFRDSLRQWDRVAVNAYRLFPRSCLAVSRQTNSERDEVLAWPFRPRARTRCFAIFRRESSYRRSRAGGGIVNYNATMNLM